MIQQALQGGIDGRLSAIVTRPSEPPNSDKPVIVLLSAGFAPKAGPFRMHVDIAEVLAQAGFSCVRFDLGGLGDSVDLPAGWSRFATTQQDVREMLDSAQAFLGCDRFVLGGLCSGAEDSFHYGLTDSRVSGLVLIEPHHFDTPRARRGRWRYRVYRKVLKTIGWFRPLDYSQPGGDALAAQTAFGDYQYSTLEQVRAGLGDYLERRIPVHYIYTGGSAERYTYRRQIFDSVGLDDLNRVVTVDRFPEISHTPIYKADRDRLASSIRAWAVRQFS